MKMRNEVGRDVVGGATLQGAIDGSTMKGAANGMFSEQRKRSSR